MLLFLLSLFAVPVRVSFARTIHPAHDLNAESVAIVYAIGDNEKIAAFLDHFVAYAVRNGTLRVVNAVENNRHIGGFSEQALKELRKNHPADASLGVILFTCSGKERSGEIGETSPGGERIRSKVQWLDAECRAKLDIRDPTGKQLASFTTHGEGTSPRSSTLDADERDIAYEQATRFAAIAAAESITPRLVRESIELDDRAPSFDDAAVMVMSDRLHDARAIWEAALPRHRNSAPLNYNLAVVCEALDDLESAGRYYKAAASFAPAEPRFRTALSEFKKRSRLNP